MHNNTVVMGCRSCVVLRLVSAFQNYPNNFPLEQNFSVTKKKVFLRRAIILFIATAGRSSFPDCQNEEAVS